MAGSAGGAAGRGLRRARRGCARAGPRGAHGGEGRRLEGRAGDAHRLGPGGPRRPAAPDRDAQRAVPGQVPQRDDQAGRQVVHRPQHHAEAGGVGRPGARRGAGEPGPPGDGHAGQGRSAAPARRVCRGLRLGRPLRARAARPQPLLVRRRDVRRRRALRRLADGRDRRPVLRPRQGLPAAAHVRRARGAAGGRQAARRGADLVRQPRQVARHPRVPGGPERVRAGRPGARLRVRARRRLVRHARERGGGREAAGVGRGGLLHERTSTASATTPPTSSSPTAPARS